MTVQLTPEQRDWLLRMVDEAILEMGPEIHHTRTKDYKDDLKEQRRALRMLRDLLAGTSPEADSPPAALPAEPIGVA